MKSESKSENGGPLVQASKYPFPYCIYQQHMPVNLDGILLQYLFTQVSTLKNWVVSVVQVTFDKIETVFFMCKLTETWMFEYLNRNWFCIIHESSIESSPESYVSTEG